VVGELRTVGSLTFGNAQVQCPGLGLAIVKSAARQLGARIEIVPGLNGKGIGFRLRWPDEALARV
jgi:two-component sensor histidine kinase